MSKPIAFHRQKAQIIQHVDAAELGGEFEAIDHRWGRNEIDVLGAEVAVPVDNLPGGGSLVEQRPGNGKKTQLLADDLPDPLSIES